MNTKIVLIRKKMKEYLKKIPAWFLVSAILFLALALSFSMRSDSIEKESKSGEEVANIVVEYINSVFLQGMGSVNLIEVSDEKNVYKIKLKFNEEEIVVYATKDGTLLFPEGFDLTKSEMDTIENQEEPEVMIEEEVVVPENIDELIGCLNKNGFKIYGANSCPYCRSLVNIFGGYEKVDSIYVECSENQELCNSKNITAYPTILLNDEEYLGDRSLDSFALATNCEL
jgi:glutaredoxin